MNTNKILTAYEDNEKKFRTIIGLSKEISEMTSDKRKIANEISDIYKVLFKNFATERIDTGIKIKVESDYERTITIFVNREGITIKGEYGDNTTNISSYQVDIFAEYLNKIKEKELEIMPFIKNKKKQDLLHDFLEEAELLEFNKYFEKDFKKELTFISEHNEKEKIVKLRATPTKVEFSNTGEKFEWRDDFSIGNLGLADKLVIEQIYEELKVMLEEYLTKEKQLKDNAGICLNNIKQKFNSQLIVNELKKQEKS